MSYQRRRGIPAIVYESKKVTDSRGNDHYVPDEDNPHEVTVWIYPQRSSKAEVPGQQRINIIRIGVPVIENVDLWTKVVMLGREWDVVTPPAYHHGTRHTRHYSLDLRERP